MKKTITILSFIALSITSKSFAQPSATALNYTSLGTKLIGYPITGTFTHQTAGANLTWDYGTVSNSAALFYVVDVPSSTQSQAVLDAFPTATYFTETNGMDNTNFVTTVSEVNSNGQFTLGYVQGGTPNVLPTPDPFLGLPLTYQSTFGARTYDAYGTLTTPFGTYTNVLRIAHASGTETNYLYYSLSPVITILMGYDVDNSTQAISGGYFYNPENTSAGINENQTENLMSVLPNPSVGKIEILWTGSKVATLQICNVLGEEIIAQQIDSKLSLSITTPGVYFANIKDGNTVYTQKIIIE